MYLMCGMIIILTITITTTTTATTNTIGMTRLRLHNIFKKANSYCRIFWNDDAVEDYDDDDPIGK